MTVSPPIRTCHRSSGLRRFLLVDARLAQLVEHMFDVHGVTGSSPVPRTSLRLE